MGPAGGHIFSNRATLPFLSLAGLCLGVRWMRSPAMEADSLALVRWPSKVNSFNSVNGKKTNG